MPVLFLSVCLELTTFLCLCFVRTIILHFVGGVEL